MDALPATEEQRLTLADAFPNIDAFLTRARAVLPSEQWYILQYAAHAFVMGNDHEGAVPDSPVDLVHMLCDEDGDTYTRSLALEDWDPAIGTREQFETAVQKLLD